MTPLLQAQITLDPQFLSRAIGNLECARELAQELLRYPEIFTRFDNAAYAMAMLDVLDPSDMVLRSMRNALKAAMESQVFLANLHRFIEVMTNTVRDLQEIDTITTTLQVVYPRIPQPTATTDHTSASATADESSAPQGKGVGDDIPF